MPIDATTSNLLLIDGSPSDQHSDDVSGSPLSLPDLDSDAVVIGLASSRCLSFSKTIDQMKRLKRRSMIIYDLEDSLPFDGDLLAIDQIKSPTGALIIAVDGEPLQPILDELEQRNIFVAGISPTFSLALGSLLRNRSIRKQDAIVWDSGKGVDVLGMNRGVPNQWRWVPDDPESIRAAIEAVIGKPSQPEQLKNILTINTDERVNQNLESAYSVSHHEIDGPAEIAAETARIIKGSVRPLLDLRDGPLEIADSQRPIARPLNFFLFSFMAMQLCLLFAIWSRGSQLNELAKIAVGQQQKSYRLVFPDQPFPVGITSRLKSEQRRLEGTRGLSNQSVPQVESILPVAHRFLAALPKRDEARFEFDRIELRPGQISLATGLAKSFAAQELLAERLRKAGLEVPPLSSESTNQGVTLRLSGVKATKQVPESPRGNP